VLNLYRCDKDGRFLRRLGFDQATTGHPSVLSNGRVVFTRWEYNDRNPVFLQPLLQMNPDGALQTEFYGGNSSWPTSLYHPRSLPGSTQVLGIASGHHTWQTGPLVLIDRSHGQENGAGLQLLAPRRALPFHRVARSLTAAIIGKPTPARRRATKQRSGAGTVHAATVSIPPDTALRWNLPAGSQILSPSRRPPPWSLGRLTMLFKKLSPLTSLPARMSSSVTLDKKIVCWPILPRPWS
jgi:hypothetical protein